MSKILEIVEWPAKVLETKAEQVEVFDDKLREFVSDMHHTMTEENGIGLAANQVNSLQRIVVMRIDHHPSDEEEGEQKMWWHNKSFTFINPVITKKEGKFKYLEGCLSFPEVYDFVDRAERVTVKAQDEHGKEFTVEADGLFSVCLQHEIDHIDGIVFINRMSRLKSSSIKKRLKKRKAILQTEQVEA